MTELCLICEKHLGRGALVGTAVWSNDTVVVSHQGAGDDGTAALGQLYVDSRGHIATFDELTPSEMDAVARGVWAAGRGLRAELSPENVFSAIVGRGVNR